ncbi:MAG TPA: type II toxin-antitoxin system VapC family toxin [Rhodanobacteraceae bacterium]|nr:type II toxin-antitoxin system VapC family toxin [Rhodanobacteraceae bacterium]
MILVDTSVWVDHLRRSDAGLVRLLESSLVLRHPFVIGELACGRLHERTVVLDALSNLPVAPVASQEEALTFLDLHDLASRGIGWVDVHLLASAALAGDARLWTRDKRLRAVADELSLGYVTAR